MDEILDKIKSGPHYLKDRDVMDIISEEMKKSDGTLYDLIAYSMMSNHVHIVIDTAVQLENIENDMELNQKYQSLDRIMKQIKGASAYKANLHLSRLGQFWERESFDIYIRNEKMLNNVVSYTLENPVKAGLSNHWEDYPGNYFNF